MKLLMTILAMIMLVSCTKEQAISGIPDPEIGPQGPIGLTGAQGVAGAQGPQGIQGLPGANGSQGATGAQGVAGAKGATGANGSQGATGATGATGANGAQGVAGAKGATGANGLAGAQGVAGTNGSTIITGATPTVNQGNDTDIFVSTLGVLYQKINNVWTYVVNLVGPQGSAGLNGSNGSNGSQGTTGATGPKGEAGAKGATGANGTNGTNGAQGATGPQGPQGLAGANGSNGAPGAVGATGPQGSPGAQGPKGEAGNSGYVSGLTCSVYKILQSDENEKWSKMFIDGTYKFSTVFSQFNVQDTIIQNTQLFPGFTTAQQALVGLVDFAMDCSGYLYVPQSNYYTFTLTSDDGAELVIYNNALINMDNNQPATTSSSSAVQLYKGYNPINILYFQGPLTNVALILKWQGPVSAGLSGTATVIPASYFFHNNN